MTRVFILLIGLVGVVSSVLTGHMAGFILGVALVMGVLGYD